MNKSRLEAFSDGVIAIILTIMVLELKVPHDPTLDGLWHLWPVYFAYLLSFVNVFMMWVAHHDIVAAIRTVNYPLLVANGVLLFFMSLVPFAMAFAVESHWAAPIPVAFYGAVMVACSGGFAWFRLAAGKHSKDPAVLASQRREAGITLASACAFLVCGAVAFYSPRAAFLMYAAVPLYRIGHQYAQRGGALRKAE